MFKSCFFIGHRDAPKTLYPALLACVRQHITQNNVKFFFVGQYFNFDAMAAKAVIDVKKDFPEVRLMLVLPYPPEERAVVTPAGFDGSYYPLSRGYNPLHPLVAANRRIIDICDCLICYSCHEGNARGFAEYAYSRAAAGLIQVKNLAEASGI